MSIKSLVATCLSAATLVAVCFAELSGLTPDRARDIQVNTNNLSYVYTNRITTSGITGLLSLQSMLEWFWLGETSFFENVWIAEDLYVGDDLTVVDDASVGGDLAVTGNISGKTGTFDTVVCSSLVAPLSSPLFSQLTYVYANTGTFSVVSATAGAATFVASTQSIGSLHVGMAVTGTTFSAGTTISSVNYTTRVVGVSAALAGSGAATCSFSGGGSYTHTVPADYSRCRVIVTGGGSSGAANAGAKPHAGGAGGTSVGFWALTPGVSYTVTVGNGGTNVSGTVVGVAGGTSSFGSLQTATGGAAQPATTMDALGGIGTGGMLNLSGGPGTAGAVGGVSFWGAGGGDGADCASTNAFNYGAGGGAADQGARSGAGHAGIVVVEYF